MSKSSIDGFGLTEFDLEPIERDPNVSEDLTSTLSRQLGWDRVRHIWRALTTDSDGRLIISTSGIQTNSAQYNQVPSAAGAFRIRPANPDRRLLLLMNNTGSVLYLGFDANVTAITGFPFAAGAVMRDDIYTGEWWAIQPLVGGNINFMEF